MSIPIAAFTTFTHVTPDGSTYEFPVRVEGRFEDEDVFVDRVLYAASGEEFTATPAEVDKAERVLWVHGRDTGAITSEA